MSAPRPPRQSGQSLPEARHTCSGVQSVMLAGASENYHRIHWDAEYARSEGLPGAIVNSGLLLAWLEALVDDTFGEDAVWRDFAVTFRAPLLLDAEAICGGAVASAAPDAGGGVRLELELWVRSPDGTLPVQGRASLEVAP